MRFVGIEPMVWFRGGGETEALRRAAPAADAAMEGAGEGW